MQPVGYTINTGLAVHFSEFFSQVLRGQTLRIVKRKRKCNYAIVFFALVKNNQPILLLHVVALFALLCVCVCVCMCVCVRIAIFTLCVVCVSAIVYLN